MTQLLGLLSSGDRGAATPLFELVYGELRSIAATRMSKERADHTLQPTALVHELYLRLLGEKELRFANRGHFFSIAGRAMERLLIEHSRRRMSLRRGGDRRKMSVDGIPEPLSEAREIREIETAELIAKGLQRLEGFERVDGRRRADMIRLVYLLGMGQRDAAKALGVSRATLQRELRYSLAVLRMIMGDRNE